MAKEHVVSFSLNAIARHDVGKGASRRLRHAESVPAVVYGAGKGPQSITLSHRELSRALENEAFYSHILDLNNGKHSEKVVLKDLQRHPYKPRIMHADFLRISATEKLTMHIPLHFIGGDVAPGVKLGGGVVAHLMPDVEVRCLPADLPEYISVDISKLELNQTLHLADLPLSKGVEIPALSHGENKPVVTIYIPRAQVETTEAPVAPVTEVAGEVKAAAEAEGADKSDKKSEKKGDKEKK